MQTAIDWIINKFLKKYIDQYIIEKIDGRMNEFHAYFKDYVKDLNIITASDTNVSKRDTGFIVVVCKIKDKDFIKILPIDERENLSEWTNMCKELTHRYGAKHRYFDSCTWGKFEREILKQEGIL